MLPFVVDIEDEWCGPSREGRGDSGPALVGSGLKECGPVDRVDSNLVEVQEDPVVAGVLPLGHPSARRRRVVPAKRGHPVLRLQGEELRPAAGSRSVRERGAPRGGRFRTRVSWKT